MPSEALAEHLPVRLTFNASSYMPDVSGNRCKSLFLRSHLGLASHFAPPAESAKTALAEWQPCPFAGTLQAWEDEAW
jgi:hypothetical protein